MLITNAFEVDQPVDTVWQFFGDIPRVAACLPGAQLDQEVGEDRYAGTVTIRMGPVRLEFAGTADVKERDDEAKRIVVDAAGSDQKGRGQANMALTATLAPSGGGTRVEVVQDLQLSGAAAQYGRGMVSDVSSVLMADFASNLQDHITAAQEGREVEATARPARGFALGLAALRLALMRVFRRFFLPYRPSPT